MNYIEFNILQNGKDLTCLDSLDKIAVNKYDNRVSKIIFHFDGTISGRIYVALLNPITHKYFISPITNDEFIICTDVTSYPGLWNLLVIGVSDDYEITDNNIDQRKLTYISNTFKRFVVRNNFLDESIIEKNDNPAIDDMIETLNISQERLENAAIKAEECADSTSVDKEYIENQRQEIDKIYKEIVNIQNTMKKYYETMISSVQSKN